MGRIRESGQLSAIISPTIFDLRKKTIFAERFWAIRAKPDFLLHSFDAFDAAYTGSFLHKNGQKWVAL
jgi:hypothetical protein